MIQYIYHEISVRTLRRLSLENYHLCDNSQFRIVQVLKNGFQGLTGLFKYAQCNIFDLFTTLHTIFEQKNDKINPLTLASFMS